MKIVSFKGDSMRSAIGRIGIYSVALLVGILSVGGHLSASTAMPVPEIDGNSIVAGVGLLSAGVLILRSRRRSK